MLRRSSLRRWSAYSLMSIPGHVHQTLASDATLISVCRVGRTCGYHGLVLDSYRPLCKDGFLGGDTEAGGGLEQGPVIRSGLDSLRAVVEMHLSSGGTNKGRNADPGSCGRVGDPRQSGEPGDLLYPG